MPIYSFVGRLKPRLIGITQSFQKSVSGRLLPHKTALMKILELVDYEVHIAFLVRAKQVELFFASAALAEIIGQLS